MQTFLPVPDFHHTAMILDRSRLGKQRVEAYQILRALTDAEYGWQDHPAVNMWRGYEPALAIYGLAICDEWIMRGYRDNMRHRILTEFLLPFLTEGRQLQLPPWIGDEAFHASHRSKLLEKDFQEYSDFDWDEEPGLEYVWPTQEVA